MMPLYEISFRIDYDCPFITLSRKYSDLRISHWCLGERDLIVIPVVEGRTIEALEDSMKSAGIDAGKGVRSDGGIVFTFACTCRAYDNVLGLAAENQFLSEPPSVFYGGWGYYRLVTFGDENVRSFFKHLNDMGHTEMLSRRTITADLLPGSSWPSCMFPDLTDKQRNALLTAHRYGYYSSPRTVTTDTIARSMGVSRSTFEDHLRKAENRIIAVIVPYLQLLTNGDKSRKRVSARSPGISPL